MNNKKLINLGGYTYNYNQRTVIAEVTGVFPFFVTIDTTLCNGSKYKAVREIIKFTQTSGDNWISDTNLFDITKVTNEIGNIDIGIVKENERYYIYTNMPGNYSFEVISNVPIICEASQHVTSEEPLVSIDYSYRDGKGQYKRVPMGSINISNGEICINTTDAMYPSFHKIQTQINVAKDDIYRLTCDLYTPVLFDVITSNTSNRIGKLTANIVRYGEGGFAIDCFADYNSDSEPFNVYSKDNDIYLKINVKTGVINCFRNVIYSKVSEVPNGAVEHDIIMNYGTALPSKGIFKGRMYWNTNLNRPFYWNGTNWLNTTASISFSGASIFKISPSTYDKFLYIIHLTDPSNHIFSLTIGGTRYDSTHFSVETIAEGSVNPVELYSYNGELYIKVTNGEGQIETLDKVPPEKVSEVPAGATSIGVNSATGTSYPDAKIKGAMFFSETRNQPVWWNGTAWVTADSSTTSAAKSGAFSDKPDASNIYVGFPYFCTNKQTAEGATDGIMIYHKGNNVWVDALGRVVS